ncbi:ABC transporter permease [Rhizobium sp. BK376]|uniref:ABC transporter permease n=1 Tax=Rhizobium sp. BK376 TaxID=2512149 RepID=UPI0010E6DB72|nr:ABC transporter permease [Rhizobium sp. BK376]TCR68168.1 peptide/nickel transport system permease protein [Rhizobium sp. BK376]
MMVDAVSPNAHSSTFWRDARHMAAENKLTLAAAITLLLFVVISILAPWLIPYDPLAVDTSAALKPPTLTHLFGTDALGRDILSRVAIATRLDIGMAIGAVALSFIIGTGTGAIAGYFGGWTDAIIGRVMDTIMAFPLFVLAMGIVAALGNSVGNIVLATAIINLPFYSRFARSEVNVRRDMTFVEAARMGGNRSFRLLTFHIVPNILPTMMVQGSLNLGWAILNAAGLSFIGLGVRPPTPEWGIMVSEGASYIFSGEWWTFVFPGAALVITVFCFNLIGDGLRDIIDPRRRT